MTLDDLRDEARIEQHNFGFGGKLSTALEVVAERHGFIDWQDACQKLKPAGGKRVVSFNDLYANNDWARRQITRRTK